MGKLEIAGHVGWLDTLTKDELTDALAEQTRALTDSLAGIKYMRLPPLQGYPVAGVLDIGGDTIATIASGPLVGQSAWSGKPIGPSQGNAWQVKRLAISGLSTTGTFPAAVSTATGAIAAGAGSAALGNGISVTGFTVTFSAPPSTAGTLVLSNVTGGPYTFNVTTTPQNPYSVTFPNPITATSSGVAPTLTAAGLGTGAGNIVMYGIGSAFQVLDQVNLIKYSADRDTAWPFSGPGSSPGPVATYPDGAMILHGGEALRLVSTGTLVATGLIRLTGEITQIPEEKLAEVIS